MVLSFVDITDRRLAEDALRLSEERHRQMCEELEAEAVRLGADSGKLEKERLRLRAQREAD